MWSFIVTDLNRKPTHSIHSIQYLLPHSVCVFDLTESARIYVVTLIQFKLNLIRWFIILVSVHFSKLGHVCAGIILSNIIL